MEICVMQVQFLGAARTVTGSRHLLTVNGKKILLDCGMFQGRGDDDRQRNVHLGFDPRSIDVLILSHAHTDHAGSIPNLVKQGFNGQILATSATRDLCNIMLTDSARIQESDVRFINKKRMATGKSPLKPIYTEEDVREAMRLFEPVDYNEIHVIEKGISFRFTDAGHILGSAAVHLELTENGQTIRLTFSGDVGRYHDLILRAPQEFPQADYIICESTYGNRLHEKTDDAALKLRDVIQRTCVEQGGKVFIPAFSLGRTQEIVYTLDRMRSKGLLPRIPVFVDSPLSTNATEIMRKHTECFNEDLLEYLETDDDPFGFNGLEYIQDKEDSMALNRFNGPCIIISASGMLEAGRIKHHVKNGISDERNTILMVGYCGPNTLGGDLMRGKKEVRIFGELHEVKAAVEIISSYSAHADYEELFTFLSCQNASEVKKVFLVHGEYETQQVFRDRLLEKSFATVEIPDQGETVILD